MGTKRAQPPLPGFGGRATDGPIARVRRGFDEQIRAQRRTGQLEQVDAALIALGRTLSDNIDAEHQDPDGSRYTVGALAGRLVPVILALRGQVAPGGDDLDAEHQALVAAIRDATGSGPPEPRP